MTISSASVEKRAREMYVKKFPPSFCGPWERLTETHKNRWLTAARAELEQEARDGK